MQNVLFNRKSCHKTACSTLFFKNVCVHVHRIQIRYSENVMIIPAWQDFKASLLFKKYDWNFYNEQVLFLLPEKQRSLLWPKVGKQMQQEFRSHNLELAKLTFLTIIFLSFSKVSFRNSGSLHPKSYMFKKSTLSQ